jgi:arabinose-5-phosphate isomerase
MTSKTPNSISIGHEALNTPFNVDPISLGEFNLLIEQAKSVLTIEAQAILDIAQKLDDNFHKSIDLIIKCKGKVVVTGIGKSGHIANKIAATFASTGTPAFFVHPAELRHGDFGMLAKDDIVIVLSGSGETQEIKLVLDPIKRLGLPIIALTGNKNSTLAKYSQAVIDVAVAKEACPLNLAPTASTTATLAIGDALAIVLMTKKGFKAEDFAASHPGGNLGRQLITVADVMRSGINLPIVLENTEYANVLNEITAKKTGFTMVLDQTGCLLGVVTDGDLRRAQVRYGKDVFVKSAKDIMTGNPKIISQDSLAVEALKIMEDYAISDVLIVDNTNKPIGLIHLKDLLKAGIV